MLKPQGKVEIVGDFAKAPNEGGKIERDTITCGHCQRLVFVKPNTVSTVYLIPQFMGPDKEEPGAGCHVCRRAICLECYALGTCHVWERKIEESEARGAFLRSAGLALVVCLLLPRLVVGQVIAGDTLTGTSTGVTVGSWTFPAGDFVPFFSASRLATATAAYAANPTPYAFDSALNATSPQYWAMRYQVTSVCGASDGTYYPIGSVGNCGDAVNYLLHTATNSLDYFCSTNAGTVCADNARYFGELSILGFNWLWPQFSATDKQTICRAIVRNVSMKLARGWGSVYSPGNNYNWGYSRNLYWAMATMVRANNGALDCSVSSDCMWTGDGGGPYDEDITVCGLSTSQLATFFAARFEDRWTQIRMYLNNQMAGGCNSEGNQYGWYLHDYLGPILLTSADYGRSLYQETEAFWQGAAWTAIYTASNVTMYGLQVGNQPSFTQPFIQDFTFGQTQFYGQRASGSVEQAAYMSVIAMLESGTTLGAHARYFVTNIPPRNWQWLKVVDPGLGEAGSAFSTLPLDYYASGCGFLYLRDSWSRTVADKPTDWLIQMKQVNNGGGNHTQCDAGTQQGRRGQRWVSKETSDYNGDITNVVGTGATSTGGTFGHHNGQTLGTENSNGFCLNYDDIDNIESFSSSTPSTVRLHRTTEFVFAASNLSPWYGNNLGAMASSLTSAYREWMYFRALDTLCTFDRIATTSAGTAVRTFEHFVTSPTNPASNVYAGENNGEVVRVSAPVPSGYTRTYETINEDTFGTTPDDFGDVQYRLQMVTSGTTLKEIPVCRDLYSTADTPASVSLGETGSEFTVTVTKGANSGVWTITRGATSTGGTASINGAAAVMLSASVNGPTVSENGISWP